VWFGSMVKDSGSAAAESASKAVASVMRVRRMRDSWLAGKREAETDDDFVGDGCGIGPLAFADLEGQALHRELSLDHALAGGFVEGERCEDVLRDSLDGELARGFEFSGAERLHGRGGEGRLGKRRRIEPGLAARFVLAFSASEVDGRELHFELRLRRFRVGGI